MNIGSFNILNLIILFTLHNLLVILLHIICGNDSQTSLKTKQNVLKTIRLRDWQYTLLEVLHNWNGYKGQTYGFKFWKLFFAPQRVVLHHIWRWYQPKNNNLWKLSQSFSSYAHVFMQNSMSDFIKEKSV